MAFCYLEFMGRNTEFRCRALLFDFDGVLVDSTASVARVWTRWAEVRGLDPEEVVRTAQGRRSIENVRRWAPDVDAEAENLNVERMEIEDAAGLKSLSGARELLTWLPADRWTIVTSSTRPLALARMKAANLQPPPAMITGNDVINGKPHPEPWLKGASLLGFAPEDCIVFEDTAAGIESGHAAGMRVIALTTTYPAEALREADCIVRSLADIAPSLDPDGYITLAAAAN
jgi:sugar-phosphatase